MTRTLAILISVTALLAACKAETGRELYYHDSSSLAQANKHHRSASLNRWKANGGCQGDGNMTTEQASFCWGRGKSANSFPPIGASEGGSEN